MGTKTKCLQAVLTISRFMLTQTRFRENTCVRDTKTKHGKMRFNSLDDVNRSWRNVIAKSVHIGGRI